MRILAYLFLVIAFSAACFAQQSQTKNEAQNFTATSIQGQTFDLAELKGKIVLMTFWSTRCPICAKETSKLNQLAARYKNKDVVFLGLTADNSTKVESFIKKKPFDFNLLPDTFGVLLKYADKDDSGRVMMSYPAYYLINQAGEIELKANGYGKEDKIDSEINRLLRTE